MTDQCQMCHVGRLHPTRATYTRIIDGTLVQAPNAAAWRCDVCGELFFEPEIVQRVEVLVGEGGPPPNHHTALGEDAPPQSDSAPAADDTPDATPHPRKL